MTFCPWCGLRSDFDLRQVHFRDLGASDSHVCPQCTTPLGAIEFELVPPVSIERCPTCLGMFFNPGEIVALLDEQTNPLVWLDPYQMDKITEDSGHQRDVFYRKCPMCPERMNHINFGGRSAVIVDSCSKHGIWLENTQLRRLTEWWRAGGKLIFQQNEAKRTKLLYHSPDKPVPGFPSGTRIDGAPTAIPAPETADIIDIMLELGSAVINLWDD